MFVIQGILFLWLCHCCYAAKTILISLDGFRHDYIDIAKQQGRDVSAFERVAREGFRVVKMENIMPSLTFSTHWSISTGRFVATHGVMGNTFWDPQYKTFFNYTNSRTNMESRWFDLFGNEPIYLTNQRHGHKSCVFFWPTSNARINNTFQYADFGLYSGAPTLEFRIDRMLEWMREPDVNLCMVYYNEPDSSGHKHGAASNAVMDKVEVCNKGIKYLLEKIDTDPLFKDEKPNLIITSDHGMTNVSNTRVIPVHKHLPFDQYEGGMDESPANLGVWPKSGGWDVQKMYDVLKPLQHVKVYLKDEVPARYRMNNSRRLAPIIVEADLGWMIQTNPNVPYSDGLKGMHGYDPANDDMKPFMVARGPDIKQLGTVQSMRQVDIYPLVAILLRLDKPNKIDGEMNNVLPLLSRAPSADWLDNFDRYTKGLPPKLGASSLPITLALPSLLTLLWRNL